jgi:hypothetical protein
MEEDKMGIWTLQQTGVMIRKLIESVVEVTNNNEDITSSDLPKRQKTQHVSLYHMSTHELSSDWNEIADEDEDEAEFIYV